MIKIAVVGSREFRDKLTVWGELAKLIKDYRRTEGGYFMELISGGARGVDTWAKEWADANKIDIEVISPVEPVSNKINYLFRNVEIITKAEKIIAFWDGKSRGTKFVIEYAKRRNKPITIIR